MKPTLQIYRDSRGEYRWRVTARNGRILADSSEGYKTKAGVQNGFKATVRLGDWESIRYYYNIKSV